MKQIPLTVVILFLAGACGMPAAMETPPPTETVIPKFTPVCISDQPTDADLERALAFTGSAFSASEWERSYTVYDNNRVSVTWLNSAQGAVVYLEALIFPCGYEEPDINNYFNEENWKTIFQNYESYQAANSCKTNDGLRLYQFTAQDQGNPYEVRFWARNDTNTRLLTLMLVFPASDLDSMDRYAGRLFPQLASCK